MPARIRRRWGAGPTGRRQSSDGAARPRTSRLRVNLSFHPIVTRRLLLPFALLLALAAPATAAAATPGSEPLPDRQPGQPRTSATPACTPATRPTRGPPGGTSTPRGAKTLRTFVLWNAIDDAAVGRTACSCSTRAHTAWPWTSSSPATRGSTPSSPAEYARAIGRLAGALRGTGTWSTRSGTSPTGRRSGRTRRSRPTTPPLLKAAYTAVKAGDPRPR